MILLLYYYLIAPGLRVVPGSKKLFGRIVCLLEIQFFERGYGTSISTLVQVL